MDDQLMKCSTCGTERVSRYAAYCHVCGGPLPELPPLEDDPPVPPPAVVGVPVPGAPAAQMPVEPLPPDPTADRVAYSGAPAGGAVSPSSVEPPPAFFAERPVYQNATPAATAPPMSPTGATPPPQDPAVGAGGGVRVYDRPEVPPSVERRKRLTWILAGVGLLIGLILLALGPLRSVLSARNQPAWTPPGTPTVAEVAAAPTLPPGVSAAQATAHARTPSPTVGPTWTAGVDLGTDSPGAVATQPAAPTGLPTLAPAATSTLRPTATPSPTLASTETLAPTATQPPTETPTVAPSPTTALSPTAADPAPTAALVPGPALPGAVSGGRALAFVSDRTGSPQIWVLDVQAGSQAQVTTQGANTAPSWSYDNRYLYYVSQRNGGTSVMRLDITTGVEEQVLQDPEIVTARPLPNGQLAVLRMEGGFYTLYAGDRRLFQLDRSYQFQFSPDGNRVLIDPNADPRVISVVDVASTQVTEVAPTRSWNAGWGRNDLLTYVSDRSGIAAVYVANAAGGDARAISPGDRWSQAPAFSSDAALVAFIAGDGPNWNVYLAPTSGGNAVKVGGPANPGKSPLWQPGGALIAYESNRAGNWDIYVTDPNGNERALTNDPGNDVDIAWTW